MTRDDNLDLAAKINNDVASYLEDQTGHRSTVAEAKS
jgi:hypothetical protein